MKEALLLITALIIFISEVSGNACPRTNKKPASECIDECQPSLGCSDRKKDCLCDATCGYSCVKKTLQCTPLKKPRNGKIIGKNRTFNSTVKFKCDPGYTLFGSSTRRCQAKGLWDGKKARCKFSCPDPKIPNFTNRDKKNLRSIGFPERTVLRYKCFPGYTTTDSLSIQCLRNGKWTSPPPVCAVRQCGRVTLPANSLVRRPRGWKNRRSHQLGTRIYLTCKPGYRSWTIVGRMECLARGWTLMQRRFACITRSCGDPGTPRDGRKNGLSYKFNDVVRYSCNNCYKLSGVSYRQCLADGSWSDKLPTCKRVICPNPSQIAHGKLSLSSQPIYCGSYVEYKCSVGYKLKGTAKRTCLGDGKWGDSEPVCEIVNCGDPGKLRNGFITTKGGFTYGNDLRFSCKDNYVLEGSLLATCESDGKWSQSLPTCLEKCSDPSRNTNGRVIGNEFYHGKEVQFICPRNFVLVPSSSKKLICRNGKWGGPIPSCKAPCSQLPSLSNGRKYGRSLTHGSIVGFYCNRGHQRVGSQRVQCNDGRWSANMPRCLAICYKIRSIRDGWVNGDGYLEGEELSFRCKQNYVLEGAKVIKCIGYRRWNASKPRCKAPCTKLRAPANGRIAQQGFQHKEIVRFACNRYYHLEGKDYLTCRDGRWNDRSPKCLAPCKRFSAEPFRFGYLKKDGFRHDEEVIFDCRDPFVIDGLDTLRCNNGAWSGKKLPTCGGPCMRLNLPRNGVYLKNGYRHKEKVKFGCKSRFQMVGTPDRVCHFGVWNDLKLPRCEKKCSNPSRDTNAVVVGRKFYNGEEVRFTCRKDKVLIPELSRKLMCVDGKWNGRIPSCKASCPALSRISHGYITGKRDLKHGSVVQFECNAGYQRIGASSARCNDGKWSERIPRCLAICKKISSIKNGQVNGRHKLEGYRVSFKCNKNYILEGRSVIRCTDTGKWSFPEPKCKASCPSLSKVPNGYITGKSNPKHGSVVQFSCNAGYQQIGAPSARCNDGKWSERIPRCLVICMKISSIKNGQVEGKNRLEGDTVSFKCNENYILEGERVIRCTNTGKWNFPAPKCKAVILPTTNPTRLRTTQSQAVTLPTTSPTRAKTTKSRAATQPTTSPTPLKKTQSQTVAQPTRKLTRPKTTQRQESCQKLGPPRNGFIQMESGNQHKDIVVFGCGQNYKLKGNNPLQCNHGTWNSSPPICERI